MLCSDINLYEQELLYRNINFYGQKMLYFDGNFYEFFSSTA